MRSLLISMAAVIAVALLLASAPSQGEAVGARTVVYVSPLAGTWEDGVLDVGVPCYVVVEAGVRTDFRGCCPVGFVPVGYGADSLLACIEE